MIGGKLKERCIRSKSCTVPWKEVKYFCNNLCQKEKILFSTFFLWLPFPFKLLSHCQRSEASFSFASKKTYFLIVYKSHYSSETELKRVANSSLIQLTFAPPSQILLGGEQVRVMSCFLLKLCPILVLYLYHVAAVSFLGPNTSQLGTSGNKSMCFSKHIEEITTLCKLHT